MQETRYHFMHRYKPLRWSSAPSSLRSNSLPIDLRLEHPITMNFHLPHMWQAWPSSGTTYQQLPPVQQQSMPFQMLQLMGYPTNTMPMLWCLNGNPTMLPSQLYGPQFFTPPLSQQMNQHHLESYRASSAGPSRDRGKRRGRRKTGSPYTNQNKHASSAGIGRDPCTGVTQPRRMGAANGTGTGWARRSPSRALSLMPDRSCQPMQKNRYNVDCSGSSLRNHRGKFRDDEPSQYEIHIEGLGGMPICHFVSPSSHSPHCVESNPHLHQVAGGSALAGIASLAPSTTANLLPINAPTVSDMTTGIAPTITEERTHKFESNLQRSLLTMFCRAGWRRWRLWYDLAGIGAWRLSILNELYDPCQRNRLFAPKRFYVDCVFIRQIMFFFLTFPARLAFCRSWWWRKFVYSQSFVEFYRKKKKLAAIDG